MIRSSVVVVIVAAVFITHVILKVRKVFHIFLKKMY